MSKKIGRKSAARKQKILRRLREALHRPTDWEQLGPVLSASNIHYEVAERTRAISHGGIGAIQLLVNELGLAERINEGLALLKCHCPYMESDHVLNR